MREPLKLRKYRMSNSQTVVIENNKEALATALELREYASTTRLMSIDGNVLNAVSVAYKTSEPYRAVERADR